MIIKLVTDVDAPPVEEKETDAIAYTQTAQAKKFVDLSNDTLRYVEKFDQWLQWNGRYWEVISKLVVIEHVRQMNKYDAFDIKDKRTRGQLCSLQFAKSVEGFCRGDPRCLLEFEELDADPWLLGTPGGIIDLRTGKYIAEDVVALKPYVTMVTAVVPADERACEVFPKFMEQFACKDKELREYCLRWGGYCLTGDMREQCLFFFYGDGDNGKTVFIQLLRWLLGGYAMTAPIELFVTVGVGKHLTGFAAMNRKRCVITNETQKGHTLRMDVIKNITGQDPIRANFMRQDTFEFLPVCKLTMFGNHKPSLPNAGKAERKRIRMIPCNLQLAAHEIDRDLFGKLQAEGPGILRALIDGCLDWQKHGLVTPECVKEQTSNYFYTQDQFKKWQEACCELGVDKQEASTVLWKSWQLWAQENKVEVGTETAFSESLSEGGFRYNKNLECADGVKRGWHGLAIAKDDPGARF